jgi:EAL and modified HD-GYP domain-containing signal transduction protein
MQTAIARGRFMEKIGSAFFEKGELDNLFITGAFSMLHLLLGASLFGPRGDAPSSPSMTRW